MAKKSAFNPLMLLLIPVSLVIILICPVLLLVRIAVFCYLGLGMNEWLSLAAGFIITFALLFLYISWLYKQWTSRKKINPKIRGRNFKIAGVILAFYVVYGLFFIFSSNAKSAAIREQYSQLHPILRIAVGAMLLFDRSAVVTDLARTHADYDQMGLEKKKKSLHYVQSDGYVHAADLRTNGRSEWKNGAMKFYFNLLGFNTLRHIGTADHLHVSLTARDNPRGI